MNARRTLLKFVCVLHLVLWCAAAGVMAPATNSVQIRDILLPSVFRQQVAAMHASSTAILSQPRFMIRDPQEPHVAPDAEPEPSPRFRYKERKWAGTCPEVKFKININTAQAGGADGSVETFRNAILAAAETWNGVTTASLVLSYDGATNATDIGFNGSNEIMFVAQGLDQPAALARFWFTGDKTIIEADIWLNDDYNWDATGTPDPNEIDLQSVTLHELGHWLALGHDANEDAIMHATIPMGKLKRDLHQNDVDGIGFIYPARATEDCPSTPTRSAFQQLLPFSLLSSPPTMPPSVPEIDSRPETTASVLEKPRLRSLSRIQLPRWMHTSAQ